MAIGTDTYVFNAPFDASDYEVIHEDGFDRVEVAGMPQSRDYDGPVVPLAVATMYLPLDSVNVVEKGWMTGVEHPVAKTSAWTLNTITTSNQDYLTKTILSCIM